ncbi:hypothetical protein Ddye_014537 [Dipteronia dyeriana]|uniref:CASP-like protein n=1 Tax=Dipteronia dyeriana TaxID=168575 RepID=A0AAD9X8J3_9ROSI|nr:hypothetical protein Ddye_014537 [Dipteronia dyeriana]
MNGQRASEAYKVAVDHHHNSGVDPAAVNGGGTTTHVATAAAVRRGFSRRAEVALLVLRALSLVGAVMAFSFMLTAKQSGVVSVYGLQLPVSSQWSHSSAFLYLAVMSAIAAAYSLLQFLITGSRLLKNAPVIPSRRQAWLILAADQIFAYAMVSAGSAASGITNLNRTGIKHTPLPSFCKALPSFCDHIAVSIAFTFFSFVSFAASSLQIVTWLSSKS